MKHIIIAAAVVLPGIQSPHGAAEPESPARDGKALFEEKCAMCHRERGMGTWQLAQRMSPAIAQLEYREDLSIDYVKYVVRNGFGIMFSIGRAEVPDAQLDAIAAYLAGGAQGE